MILVTYDVRTTDVGGTKRLRRIARLCQDFGQRVQLSVFEIQVDAAQWAALKHRLSREIDPTADSLRFYYLGNHWQRKVEHLGAKTVTDLQGPLVL